MKLILSESQYNRLLTEESVKGLLKEAVSYNDLVNTIKACLAIGVSAAVIQGAIKKCDFDRNVEDKLVAITKIAPKVDSLYQQKVQACKDYMEYALKNQGYGMDSTKLNPETLVKEADAASFDLPFLMAAAHLESCFGATNLAQKTGSVFSEGLWDNGKIRTTYSDPNDSVGGYIRLLNNDYLLGGKSLDDLMKPDGFTNKNGHRYASDKNYEGKLKNVRARIIRMFPVLAEKGVSDTYSLNEAQGLKSQKLFDIFKQYGRKKRYGPHDIVPCNFNAVKDEDVVGVFPYSEIYKHGQTPEDFVRSKGIKLNNYDGAVAYELRKQTEENIPYCVVIIVPNLNHDSCSNSPEGGFKADMAKKDVRRKNHYNDGAKEYQWKGKEGEHYMLKNPWYKEWGDEAKADLQQRIKGEYGDALYNKVKGAKA